MRPLCRRIWLTVGLDEIVPAGRGDALELRLLEIGVDIDSSSGTTLPSRCDRRSRVLTSVGDDASTGRAPSEVESRSPRDVVSIQQWLGFGLRAW